MENSFESRMQDVWERGYDKHKETRTSKTKYKLPGWRGKGLLWDGEVKVEKSGTWETKKNQQVPGLGMYRVKH